jgi:hypothetical protein
MTLPQRTRRVCIQGERGLVRPEQKKMQAGLTSAALNSGLLVATAPCQSLSIRYWLFESPGFGQQQQQHSIGRPLAAKLVLDTPPNFRI